MEILSAGETTPTLFDEITFVNAVENQGLENRKQDVVVNAYAIQTNNINGDKTDPQGVWEVITNTGITDGDQDTTENVPTVDDLLQQHEFEYYSSLALAVNDVNANTIGANADVDLPDAVAGIYVDDGDTYVVLLKDATETAIVSPAVDMTINLAGNTLTTEGNYGIEVVSGDTIIDGRLEGSTIQSSTSTRLVVCQSGAVCAIDNGAYTMNVSSDANTYMIASYGTMSIDNATITGTQNGTAAIVGVNCLAGTLEVSNCDVSTIASGNAFAIQVVGEAIISDCDMMSTSTGGISIAINQYGDSIMSNCNINVIGKTSARGIDNSTKCTLEMSDCNITATSPDGKSLGINNYGTATMSDCNIKAYANYIGDESSYLSSSIGVDNTSSGTITLNDCYVMGTHSGVSARNKIYINGGTYESYGHGGIYFCKTGTTAYVRNATIRQCAMPNGYDVNIYSNGSGFYIGGGSGQSNMTIYMDNCDIYGSEQPIVLRGTSGEKNNTLYISNSRINKDYASGIRIDNNTHKLYLGVGNNFTVADVAQGTSSVIVTDDVYIMN
jgi:hypothetical protein